MLAIKGITVYLYDETATGEDDFGMPIVSGAWVPVDNVLVGEPTTDEITSSTQLYGKKLAYVLAIPKGDTHDWQDRVIEWTDAYGKRHLCRTFGFPITGIEANLPRRVPWHMKVRCEAYES